MPGRWNDVFKLKLKVRNLETGPGKGKFIDSAAFQLTFVKTTNDWIHRVGTRGKRKPKKAESLVQTAFGGLWNCSASHALAPRFEDPHSYIYSTGVQEHFSVGLIFGDSITPRDRYWNKEMSMKLKHSKLS